MMDYNFYYDCGINVYPHLMAMEGRYEKANRTQDDIKYIVVHYTGVNGDTVQSELKNAHNNFNKSSAHIFVDSVEAGLSVDFKDIAWHCGAKKYKHKDCRNKNSIGIEMCSKYENGVWSIEPIVVDTTLYVISNLMTYYNIPLDNVVRHYDVTGKLCPRPYVDEENWSKFKSSLESRLEFMGSTRYRTLDDIPSWARKSIETCMEHGILNGTSVVDGKPILDLSPDMVRCYVSMSRIIEMKGGD